MDLFCSFKFVIKSKEIFLFKFVNFSNFLTIAIEKANKSSFESILSLTISVAIDKYSLSFLHSKILTLSIPSTKTFIVPSGNFKAVKFYFHNQKYKDLLRARVIYFSIFLSN